LTGTPIQQPATPPIPFDARRRTTFGMRAARRGTAVVRAVFLIGFTGFLVAGVLATVFAGLVIAINGRLP